MGFAAYHNCPLVADMRLVERIADSFGCMDRLVDHKAVQHLVLPSTAQMELGFAFARMDFENKGFDQMEAAQVVFAAGMAMYSALAVQWKAVRRMIVEFVHYFLSADYCQHMHHTQEVVEPRSLFAE